MSLRDWMRRLLPARHPEGGGFGYVYVEVDGSARECTLDEREYLEAAFLPGDGAAPHVKPYYRHRTPSGSIAGFLRRTDLPLRIPVAAGTPVTPAHRHTREKH